jgi:hypothetical protein
MESGTVRFDLARIGPSLLQAARFAWISLGSRRVQNQNVNKAIL